MLIMSISFTHHNFEWHPLTLILSCDHDAFALTMAACAAVVAVKRAMNRNPLVLRVSEIKLYALDQRRLMMKLQTARIVKLQTLPLPFMKAHRMISQTIV